MMKKSLLFALCLVILLALLPAGALAGNVSGEEFVSFARENCLNIPYKSGGRTTAGFDCCGLVWYVCNHFGIDIGNGNQTSQIKYGSPVSYSMSSYDAFLANLQLGDLIFFDYENDGVSNHVGIYSGNGHIIQAHRTGVNSKEDKLSGGWVKDGNGNYIAEWKLTCGIRRVLTSGGSSTLSGACGESAKWVFYTGTGDLIVQGSGAISDYDFDPVNTPWKDFADEIKTVTVSQGITAIGERAFRKLPNLTSASIADSVTEIRNSAFLQCSNLTTVNIPSRIISVGPQAFEGCPLDKITLPNTIQDIGRQAFSHTAITSIVFPSSLDYINNNLFSGCTNLKSITIPKSVKRINRVAFYNCTNLTDVYYESTQMDWSEIVIEDYNDPLKNATIHSSIPSVTFDLNGYLDGITLGSIEGYGNCDVYMNGSLVADDTADYCTEWPYGTSYEIRDIRATTGHEYNGVYSGTLSGTIGSERVNVYLSFNTCSYHFDLNGYKDGVNSSNITDFGTCDIYINGTCIAQNVSDFYDSYPYGTSYAVRNIRPADGYSYEGVNDAEDWFDGTISHDTDVFLRFDTIADISEEPNVNVLNGHTYLFFTTPRTWYAAERICEWRGGHLATITSQEENDFIATIAGASGAWLGGTDRDSEGNWAWITGEDFSYTNWYPGEPNNTVWNHEGSENYMNFSMGENSNGRLWNDTASTDYRPFVCEIDSASYTLSFDSNGGVGNMPAITAAFDELITCPRNSFVKEGYSFVGWYFRRDTDGYWYTGDARGFASDEVITSDGLEKVLYEDGAEFWIGYGGSTTYSFVAVWIKPDFVLPGALREVGEEAFAGAAFSYVHLPEEVTKIDRRAFADCPNLRNIDIPAETTYIDAKAFEGVSNLTIHGEDGSYAEFYAVKYGFDFVAD